MLILCPSCARHVRSAEPACPFCASALPEREAPSRPRVSGLGRAAILAFSTAIAAAACGGGSSAPEPADRADTAGGDEQPPPDQTGPSDPAPGEGDVVAMYGAPAPVQPE